MKMKQILIIFIVFITLSLLWSCGEASNKVTAPGIQVSPAEAKDTSSDASKEYTHPVGQSLSTFEISTKDFEHNYPEVYEDRDPISDVFVTDLDGNGFDEIYIITTGFASNKDKSLSMINFPEIQEGDENFEGYMGHDTFKIENQKLVRIFPIYNNGDTNQNPTGGIRKLVYGLYQGEAMWQLKVEKSETLNSP
jgi:hypothetical protein